VTPEAAHYLGISRTHLAKARDFLEVLHYSDEAARASYLAGFNAAQALIFTRNGRIARTHRGCAVPSLNWRRQNRVSIGRLRNFSHVLTGRRNR
jgi:uncharacterized protein (UPF0332 family)